MATFRKIVLGLLLLLSLVVGQPSNAQGLKYRGTVGIPYIDDEIQRFDAVPVNGYVIELGKDCAYRIECEPDKITNKTRLVLRQRIPISNMPQASHSMVSPDGRYLVIVGYQNKNTGKTLIWCYDFQSKTTFESTYDGYIRKISNIVDNQLVLVFNNGAYKYNILSGTFVRQSIGFLPYEAVDFSRGFYCSFDGSSIRHVIGNTYFEVNSNGEVVYRKNLSDSNAVKVDADGNINYFGGRFASSGPSYVISRSGVLNEINMSKDNVGAFVRVKDVVICSSGILDTSRSWNIIGDDEINYEYDGVLRIFSYQDYRLAIHPQGVSYSDYNLEQAFYSRGGDFLGRFSQMFKPLPGFSFMYSWLVRSRFADANTSWSVLNTGVFFRTEWGQRPIRMFQIEGSVDFCFDVDKNLVVLSYNSSGAAILGFYTQQGQLLKSVVVPFEATTVDKEPDGNIVIGGYDSENYERVSRLDVVSMEIRNVLTLKAAETPANPIYVSSGPNGDIYINRSGYQRKVQSLSVYSRTGNLIQTIDNIDSTTDELWVDTGYQVVDELGVVFVAAKLDNLIKIYFADPNPPKTSASITSGWYKSNQTVQLTSLDPRPSSGFKALHSVLDTDAEVVDANPNRTINISGDGQHKLVYWAEDVDGNIETKNELTVGIDSVPPVVDSVVEGNKFILLANDDRSGIASVRYSVDGANDLEYSGEVSLPYGSYEVVFWATDKAGNKSTVGKILVGSTFRWKSVYSSPIYAGKTLKATLELSAPAGSNGVTLDISASDPSLGSITTAKILPGTTATTIEIPVLGVESDRLVDLSASLGGKTARTSVMVLVPYPSLLSINPRDVMGGNNVTITIKLPSVAPIGGQKITLYSSDLRIVVPESVTVPSGQTTITLPIATQVSSTPFSATINARAGGKGSDAVVNVLPLPSATFTISPAILNPGQKAVGVIALASPAPASGVQFKLSSSSQDITLPSTVTILPGSVRVLFDITAKSPITPVTATVTATVDKTKLTSKVSINPSAFKAVKLSSSSFSGEGSVVGTVELTGVAPSSGSLISLASNNANVSLPATVFVPAGSLIANFTVDVKEVKTPGIATITARSGVVVKFASLTLAPITVKTLEAVPSVVTGGSASVLRIELSGKPGPGGITITLSSSKPSVASVPASAAVAQGTTIVEVPIATSTVQTATEVVLSARVGTLTKQATITVNP